MKWPLLLACGTLAAQTFHRDIQPILNRWCAPCHRPGEAAPFSLLTYADAKARAKQISAVTQSRYMPPWPPEPGKGDFAGVRRLSAEELRNIAAWAAAGAPEGNPADAPPLPKFTEGWQNGTPDLVIQLETPYTLAASGSDVFRNFVLRVPVDRTRYVRAAEIRPGNKKVVHHANVLIDRAGSSRIRGGKDGQPGFPGMDVRIESAAFDPDSHFLFWKPGTVYSEEGESIPWRIDPGTDLVLNMHLQPSGKPEPVQPSIGLYFTDREPAKVPILVQLEHDGALDIPPGKGDFAVTDKLVLPVDVDVLGIYPHAHYIGKDVQAWATLPDGSRRWLIHIPDWDINWQAVYRYKQPVSLPKGTVISMRIQYDNSESNPRNPSHPPIRVVNGDRSIDEMAHVWLQLLPRGTGDHRLPIQEAVLRRRLEKYPSDFYAQYSLAAIAQSRGEFDRAIGLYRAALQANPGSSTAHNALGVALQRTGKLVESVAEFQAALHADANYADAHYNLARSFLAGERYGEAIAHLREALRIQPSDAVAMTDLGGALVGTGAVAEGVQYLREAVRLRPDYFIARFNLGQGLAMMGRRAEAEAELQEAVRLNPADRDAQDALARIKR